MEYWRDEESLSESRFTLGSLSTLEDRRCRRLDFSEAIHHRELPHLLIPSPGEAVGSLLRTCLARLVRSQIGSDNVAGCHQARYRWPETDCKRRMSEAV